MKITFRPWASNQNICAKLYIHAEFSGKKHMVSSFMPSKKCLLNQDLFASMGFNPTGIIDV
jgi:hypothetical protein